MKNKLIIPITYILFAVLLISCAAITSSDKYSNFEELSDNEVENVDYAIDLQDLNTDTTVIAIHGGNIEAGTSELAKEVSKDKYNFYSFEGIKNKGNFDLHIKSTNFDEPTCIDLIKNSEKALSMHGFKSDEKTTYVGGLDDELAKKIENELKKAGFATGEAPKNLSGKEKGNIVNLNKNGEGVQLEISAAQRKSFFVGGDFSSGNRKNTTDEFYEYTEAIKEALD